MFKKPPSFNKKKWLKNHLEEILRLKKQGLTHQAIIQSLQKQQKMPFELDGSLLSRYLKEFSNDELTTLQTKTALNNKIERQNDRLTRQNNEIQNLNRRLERVLERDMHLDVNNQNLKERNRILENKFLEGEARLKNLHRYNGYGNLNWKVKDLEEKNDDWFQTVLHLERLSERLAEPHEQTNAQIEQLTQTKEQLEYDFHKTQAVLTQIQQKNSVLVQDKAQDQQKIKQLKAHTILLNCEKQTLSNQLSEVETALTQKNQDEISELTNKKRELIQTFSAMKQHIKRIESDLSQNDRELRQTVYELHESEKNAKQHRFIAYGFMFICLVLLVFLFI
jgi:myosin heavy subunit